MVTPEMMINNRRHWAGHGGERRLKRTREQKEEASGFRADSGEEMRGWSRAP